MLITNQSIFQNSIQNLEPVVKFSKVIKLDNKKKLPVVKKEGAKSPKKARIVINAPKEGYAVKKIIKKDEIKKET
jgi:hypothetical protein